MVDGQMTWFTLITGIVISLGVASWVATIVLGVIVFNASRKIASVRQLQAEMQDLSRAYEDLSQTFKSWQNRAAVRDHRWRKKNETQDEEEIPSTGDPREDIVRKFQGQQRATNG